LNCARCGAEVQNGAAFCNVCGQPTGVTSGETANAVSASSTKALPKEVYAGFWLRAIAYVVDSIILGVVVSITILGPLIRHAGLSLDNPWVIFTSTNRQVVAINLLMIMLSWLYWALLESSRWQATLGKKLLGLYVTDLQGKPVTFARASGRYFGKLISSFLLLVGYFMAGFTEKKQALHDMLASCLVLKRS
jgi:uncharacterized RDD family membrane protein YckC